MAQKGRFVEDVTTQSSSFTSASRGQISDRSLGTLFKGAGSVVGDAIKVADNQFRDSIQNKVDDFYEKETEDQDPAIMEFSSEGVPSELTSGTDNILKMSKAFGNGLISDTQFFMRASALAKRLKTQYPGHKEFVDSALAQARGTSANMARKHLLNNLDKLSSASQKSARDQQKALNAAYEEGFITPQFAARVGPEAALQAAAVLKGRSAAANREIELIESRQKTKTISQTEATDDFIKNIRFLTTQQVNTALAKSLGFQGDLGNLDELETFFLSQDPKNIPPEQLSEIFSRGNQLINQIERQVYTHPAFQGLGATGQQKVRDSLALQLGGIKKHLQNKNFDGMNAAVQAQSIETKAYVAEIKNHMRIPAAEAVQEVFQDLFPEGTEGRAVADKLFQRQWEDPAMKLISKGMAMTIGDGITNVPDIFSRLESVPNMSGKDKANAMFSVIKTGHQVFKTRSPDDPRFRDTAESMFRENPDKLLRHWDTQQARLDMINLMIDPSVSLKIMQTDPNTANAYKDFVVSAFSSVTTSEIGDLNRQAARYMRTKARFQGSPLEGKASNMEIGMNPDSGRFEVKSLTGTLDDQSRTALESMQKINSLLDRVMPILEADGTETAKALTFLLANSKHQFDQDPWAGNIAEVLDDWWRLGTSQDALDKGKRDREDK